MSDLYNRQLTQASKYTAVVKLDFKNKEDNELVKMLIKEAYIAGMNDKLANESLEPKEATLCQDIVCCPFCGQEYKVFAPQMCSACNNVIP